MGVKEKKQEIFNSNEENITENKKKIRTIKNQAKIEGGFTWYLTAITFLLIGILFKTKLSGIGVILFIIVGVMKSYESYLYGQVIYYSCINKDKKSAKEFKDKLKSYPNSLTTLEKIRLLSK